MLNGFNLKAGLKAPKMRFRGLGLRIFGLVCPAWCFSGALQHPIQSRCVGSLVPTPSPGQVCDSGNSHLSSSRGSLVKASGGTTCGCSRLMWRRFGGAQRRTPVWFCRVLAARSRLQGSGFVFQPVFACLFGACLPSQRRPA